MRILLILVSVVLNCCTCTHSSLYKTQGTGKMFHHVRNHIRQKRDPNSFFVLSQPPKRFSGKLSDISQRVLRSKPGTVVTNRGIPHVWRRKETRSACYTQCQREQLISCEFYFLFKEDRKCIMMEQDYGKQLNPTDILKEDDMPVAPNLEVEQQSTDTPKLATVAPIPGPKTIVPTDNLNVTPNPVDSTTGQPKDTPSPPSKTEEIQIPTDQDPSSDLAPVSQPEPTFKKASKPTNSFVKDGEINKLRQMVEKVERRLDASVNSLQTDSKSKAKLMHDLQAIETSVQNSIVHLSDKVKHFDKQNPVIIEKVNEMHTKQEAIVGQVENMASYENEMASALTNIDQKVSDLDSDLAAIKETNDKISRQLIGDEMANPEFNRQILSLRRKMMDLTSRVEMNPTMTKMMKNQQVLSEALEAVDRELAVFERRQNRIEENTGDWGGRLIAEEQHRKTINDVLQSVTKAVKDVRKDVTRLQNPLSAENAEKTKEFRQMKSDIKILEKSNAKLEQDVFHVRSDLTRLIKDLVNVQMSTFDSKNSIVALVEANKNLKLDYHQQKVTQNQMITQIQTLSTVYRSVLSALHSLELKQIQVMHHLGKYENDVARVSNDVVGNEKNKILHNMPLISKMRKFQLQLLKQVNNLKRDLLKIHQKLKEQPQQKHHKEKAKHHHHKHAKVTMDEQMRKLQNKYGGGNGNMVNGNNRIINGRIGPPSAWNKGHVGTLVQKLTNPFQTRNLNNDNHQNQKKWSSFNTHVSQKQTIGAPKKAVINVNIKNVNPNMEQIIDNL